MTAAIYLARARVDTLVVDEGTAGGQMVFSHQIANYPGAPETTGAELSRNMLRQARSFGAEVLTQTRIERLDLTSTPKVLELEDEGTVTADVVILATGGIPRQLGIEAEQRLKSRGISYCATCDGDFFRGQNVVAIGGGNSAVEEAIALARHAKKVTIVHEFDSFQAQPYLVDEARHTANIEFLMNQRVTDFLGEEQLEAVVSVDRATGQRNETRADGCFIFIGYVPRTQELAGIIELTERGEIITDESLATNVPGVYAAGDCRRKRYRQITTSVADGTIAALSVIEHLDHHKPQPVAEALASVQLPEPAAPPAPDPAAAPPAPDPAAP
jgi:thioredoxin reductase (NADPH)